MTKRQASKQVAIRVSAEVRDLWDRLLARTREHSPAMTERTFFEQLLGVHDKGAVSDALHHLDVVIRCLGLGSLYDPPVDAEKTKAALKKTVEARNLLVQIQTRRAKT